MIGFTFLLLLPAVRFPCLRACFFLCSQNGEDMRQDQLAVHMVSLMDRQLKEAGLDLKLKVTTRVCSLSRVPCSSRTVPVVVVCGCGGGGCGELFTSWLLLFGWYLLFLLVSSLNVVVEL